MQRSPISFNSTHGGETGASSGLDSLQVYKELPSDQITEEFLWGRLRPLLDYLSPEDIEKVQEALSLASDAHAGQLRKSGEPFITHPLEVSPTLT